MQDIKTFKEITNFIRTSFRTKEDFIPLHVPSFIGNEKKYVIDTIDSTFVSSVGGYVNRFEKEISAYTGSEYAVATMNGTAALHIALLLAGVERDDLVITQSFTFVATGNAIAYCNASPIFVDIEKESLGMCPNSLKKFLENETEVDSGYCVHKKSRKKIKACVPMHTFGHPCKIDEIAKICNSLNIKLVEDAAESLGSYYKDSHTGTFGDVAAISFNGNKVITGGSGGIILFKNEDLAKKAKHITTTAKVPHRWEYVHDSIGYNYRLPNLNSALLCGQLENIDQILKTKRKLAHLYKEFFNQFKDISFIDEPTNAKSNFWLNAIMFKSEKDRDTFLEHSNSTGIMTRPAWKPLHTLEMFKSEHEAQLPETEKLEKLIVNIPSSYIEDL